MITTDVPDEVLLWVMRDGTHITILGSIHGTGVIYLAWDPKRSDQHINRSHHEASEALAHEWLTDGTDHLSHTGSVFVFRPQVLLMAGPGPERSELGFWVERTVRRYVENELAARV